MTISDLPGVAAGTRPLGLPDLPRREGHPEDTLHAQIWKDLKWVLPPEVVAWSHENRHNGVMEGQRRKARGIIAGVPDMVFHWPDRRVVYVELKTDKGTLNDAQKVLHPRIAATGIPIAVCRSFHDVLRFLEQEGCPLRCRVL